MTLYEKRGRRYYPVAEQIARDSFPAGSTLVCVQLGSSTRYFNIDPDYAAVLAACYEGRDKLMAILAEAMRPKPPRQLTELERKAVEAYYDVIKDENAVLTLWTASVADCVDAFIKAVQAAAKESK